MIIQSCLQEITLQHVNSHHVNIVACQRGGGLQYTASPRSRDETRSVNPLVRKKVDLIHVYGLTGYQK